MRMRRGSLLLGAVTVMAVGCEHAPQGIAGPPAQLAVTSSAATPLDAVGEPAETTVFEAVAAQQTIGLASTTVVSLQSAPGPDGVQGTADDVRFDATFPRRYQRTEGALSVNFASPTGQEWRALGVIFDYSAGGEALTIGVNGCLGSQLPAPAALNNWDGGVRMQFVGSGGLPAVVTRVAVDMVIPGSSLAAYDLGGNLLGSQTLTVPRAMLTVTAPGIARVEMVGNFWCIGQSVEFDNLTASPTAIISQIDALINSGAIDAGVGASLQSMLRQVEALLLRGSSEAALNVVNALISHTAAQSGKHIDAAAAAQLQSLLQGLAASI